jgi:hypothetical protein
MKKIEERIDEAVAQVDLRKPETFQQAANIILTEDLYVNNGEEVAIIDDPTYPYSGQKARVIGPSDKGGGWVDVEFDNGVRFPVQSSLLLKIK